MALLQKLTLLTLLLVLNACGGGGSSGSGGNGGGNNGGDGQITLTGVVQKGRFLNGRVNAYNPVSRELVASSPIEAGAYRLNVPKDAELVLEAQGEFSDETSGAKVELRAPISSLLKADRAKKANINLLTNLVAKRALADSSNDGFDAKLDKARDLVAQNLGFGVAVGSGAKLKPSELDLSDIKASADAQDPNLQLLLFSAATLLDDASLTQGGYQKLLDALESNTDTSSQLQSALKDYAGSDAAAIYERVKESGLIEGLPVLDLASTLPILSCEPRCQWLAPTQATISVSATRVLESEGQALITVRANRAPDQAMRIRLAPINTSATNATNPHQRISTLYWDYLALAQELVLPAGQTLLEYKIDLVLDQLNERDEVLEFDLSLANANQTYVLAKETLKLTISDARPDHLLSNPIDRLRLNPPCFAGLINTDGNTADALPSGQACRALDAQSLLYNASEPALAKIQLQLSHACAAGSCSAAERASFAQDRRVDLVLQQVNGDVVVAEQIIATPVLNGALILEQQPQWFVVNFITANAFIQTAAKDADELRLEARLKGTQTDGTSRVQASASALPRLLAMPGQISVQQWAVDIAVDTVQLDFVGAMDETPANECGVGEYRLQGQAIIADQRPVFDVCVVIADITDDASQNPLPGQALPSAEFNLTRGSIDLAAYRFELPDGMGMLRSVFLQGQGQVQAQGSQTLMLASKEALIPQESEPGQESGESSAQAGASSGYWLVDDKIPLAFLLSGASLTPEGIALRSTQIKHWHQRDFGRADTRANQQFETNSALLLDAQLMVNPVAGQAGPQASLLINDSGLQARLALGQSEFFNQLYPKAQVKRTAQATLSIVNSEVIYQAAPELEYQLSQSSRCQEANCVADQPISYRLSSSTGYLGAKGMALLDAQSLQSSAPSWGVIAASGDDDDKAFVFSRGSDLNAGQEAKIALPGWSYGYNIGADLLGHIERYTGEQLALRRFSASQLSSAAHYGAAYPSGIVLGPEGGFYHDASGAPELGSGRDLSGLALTLNAAGTQRELASSSASKYVIRNSGITGVFNISPDALGQALPVYGFDLELSRFAFSVVDNQLSERNWIDGALNLEGDAGLEVVFENLELGCDGRFGQASVVYESCDRYDNNNNGFIDENCPQMVLGWQSNADLFAMAFVFDAASAAQCGEDNAQLSLVGDWDFRALDKPLKIDSRWNPQGEVVSSSIDVAAHYRLEQAKGSADADSNVSTNATTNATTNTSSEALLPGFAIIPTQGRLKQLSYAGSSFGVIDLQARFALPFWQAMDNDLRIANRSQLIADASVVAPSGLLNQGEFNTAKRNNAALQAWLNARDEYHLQAQYRWGGTGFGFELPVVYQGASAKASPQFLGKTYAADLFVLQANAGIDFIKPANTKLSFGASADFDKLREVQFQVNLSDPDNLALVDQFLLEIDVIDEPVIEPSLNLVQSTLGQFNQLANRGLEETIEQALIISLEQTGAAVAPNMPLQQDPLLTVSQLLAELKALPQRSATLMDLAVYEPSKALLVQSEAELRLPLQSLLAQIRAIDSVSAIPPEFWLKLAELEQSAASIEAKFKKLQRDINTGLNKSAEALVKVQLEVAKRQSALNQAEQMIAQAVAVSANECTNDAINLETAHYLKTFFDGVEGGQQFLQLAQNAQLIGAWVAPLGLDEDVRTQLAAAQATIRQQAVLLEVYLAQAVADMKQGLCAEENLAVLTGVQTRFERMRVQLRELTRPATGPDDLGGVIEHSLHYLSQAQMLSKQVKQYGLEPLGQLRETLARVRQVMLTQVGDLAIDQINQLIPSISGGLFSVILLEPDSPAGASDIFTAAFAPLHSALDTEYSALKSAMLAQMQANLPGVYFSPQQLRQMIAKEIMRTPAVAQLRQQANTHLAEINKQVNDIALLLTDQINSSIQSALAGVENQANQALEAALAPVRDIPLSTAALNGYGVISHNELERAHLSAKWTMLPPAPGQKGAGFHASLDALSWNASNKSAACDVSGGQDAMSRLDVTISTYDLPGNILASDILFKKIYLGFTLESGSDPEFAFAPRGVFGGISTEGSISFTDFQLMDVAFAAGLGDLETYLGASAAATIPGNIQAEAAFLVGRTCNQDILNELDPRVGQFLELPDSGFSGAYARAGASIPVYSNGCPLMVGLGADFGAWYMSGPPQTFGGLIGGGAYGTVACAGALRGQVLALAQFDETGNVVFAGEGFGAAGVGVCKPEGWTTLERSRRGAACFTADAVFRARYSKEWELLDLEAGAIYK